MSRRERWIQQRQRANDQIRLAFEGMGTGRQYCQQQKDYTFHLIDEYGVRATARILQYPAGLCSDGAAVSTRTFAGVRTGSTPGRPNAGRSGSFCAPYARTRE
jgi:hypothetical protein